ncbi:MULTISPECIES: class I SAM-dependent methyltransferase [Halomonadaceae]|uniref:class I SAM-dependent methyltransferase n=1 Tax=Halomonadaceae TaxID=28256 RepID=UPI0012F2FC89|nr:MULTISPECIES: class I SAM-dependent methyltransferase [Halomonas]CAD5264946.1 conserved hypothetical protein [Halomonas sp. 156]CAD5266001.1 conserved hypothetical protein [Halomonas sp. I3]CAD5283759.1 conserved hypothetical protein [Halomonas sp. 113]CAD5285193.1 conserved hypothetical protein [Halomonas sp. 59]VXB25362.1 conserved hypothetical protein [Halomonas titanicae]
MSDRDKELEDLKKLFKELSRSVTSLSKKIEEANNSLYSQIESLLWLNKRLKINGELPPLRGWPVSPDFLLRLHQYIIFEKPRVIVETGSGATTIVIADALRQNGFGKLYSFEHLKKYATKTEGMLKEEFLTPWVELLVGKLEPWEGNHLNPSDADKPSVWYPLNLTGIEQVDLLIVDGPPKSSCQYARYPALPALFDRLSPKAQVWMDDAIRQEEKDICKHWANEYGFDFEYFALEKGLGVLTRS